ncbi:hypothetical protein SI65_09856 [Aspergillus cristatus]|uniref:Uncharacterized protein n=1 Tax=Aspergillus cristatus TaxID=573508 RepID=A0A1E3B174_ASPCR|nr:hypothetical protein SI65_09856 [Aspergillus cristatus]
MPKHNRGFSFGSKSSKSHRSSTSANRVALTESAEEKQRRNLQTKADPTLAMSELQPMAVALEKSNLGNLRDMAHKDQYGNVITDPDLSNPTRPRLERPLDTIRSFEVAIDGTYASNNANASRPASVVRTDEPSPGDFNRRTSYLGANAHPSRRGSYNDYNQPNNYYPYHQNTHPPRPRHPRITSNQSYGTPRNAYAQNGYQNGSYDNITAMSGSGSGSGSHSEPYNGTDPSSVNSSIDQLQQQQQMQQQQGKGYGPGYDQPIAQPMAPPAPRHVFGLAPASDPNAGGPVGGQQAAAMGNRRHLRKATNDSEASAGSGKRKSWFKRKFSKS